MGDSLLFQNRSRFDFDLMPVDDFSSRLFGPEPHPVSIGVFGQARPSDWWGAGESGCAWATTRADLSRRTHGGRELVVGGASQAWCPGAVFAEATRPWMRGRSIRQPPRWSGPTPRLVVEFRRSVFVSDLFLHSQTIISAVSSCVELLRPLRELRPLHKLLFRWRPRLQNLSDGFDV